MFILRPYLWSKIASKYLGSDDPQVRKDLELLFRVNIPLEEHYNRLTGDLSDPNNWIRISIKDFLELDRIVYKKPQYVAHINSFVVFLYKITAIITYAGVIMMLFTGVIALFARFVLGVETIDMFQMGC
jgi:hypothetical protein